MATTRSRGEFAMHGEIIRLTVGFRDSSGNFVDTDLFPQISIQQPSGTVLTPFTSAGVYRLDTGVYGFDFSVEANANYGVWTDNWQATIGGLPSFQERNFVVQDTQLPAINTDGYVHLGDAVPFDYSQNALKNINKILAILKARLNSSGKSLTKDENGNDVLMDCDIYTIEQLTLFVIAAIKSFNMIPHFTTFSFEDTEFLETFCEIIVRHALVYALASKALIEKGREFAITDNGVGFTPPGVSDILMTQYSSEYTHWETDVRLIKQNMKPAPLGLGTMTSMGTSRNPAVARLRHLRARQII